MYTQCPECQTAFRVTAKVLQQANGRVRCGGCGSAFSAIDFLSEEMPTPRDVETAPPPPEPQDELSADDELAQTSKQLLATLEELAGPEDVRIEDTGVEWRVLDEDEAGETEVAGTSETGSVRWYLEEADTNLPEVSDEVTEEDRAVATNVDEMRFDDNTPLPDDFGAEVDGYVPPVPQRRTSDIAAQEAANVDEKQADLALSEPDEWDELLDEFSDEQVRDEDIPLEIEEELAAIHNELQARPEPIDDADAAEPEPDLPSDIDTQFDIQAEAMGLDTTGSRQLVEEDAQAVGEDAQDESADDESADEEEQDGAEEQVEAHDGEPATPEEDREEDREDEEAVEAVAAAVADEDVDGSELDPTDEFRAQIDEAAAALARQEFDLYEESAAEREIEAEAEEPPAHDEPGKPGPGEDVDEEDAADAAAETPAEEESPAESVEAMEDDSEDDESAEDSDDGMEDDESADKIAATFAGIADPSELFDESSGEVETIIMEGEFVRGSLEKERLEAERKAAANLREGKQLADTYALNRGMVKGGRRHTDPAGTFAIAAIVVLALLLVGQFVHASRESLATNALFNNTIAPIYRLFGSPITPQWDIKGWQFEATNGSTDESEQVLTISSRITNRSDQLLPYPLVHVSLADRFEEIIGSRVLEPGEYLAGDLDPRRPVSPGDNFTAVITIGDLSPDATGFKLNVCYRVSGGDMRCATEDFKN